MITIPEKILQSIAVLQHVQPLVIVGIDGGGGAGKTTFAATLAATLQGNVEIIHTDDYQFSYDEPPPFDSTMTVYQNFDFERIAGKIEALQTQSLGTIIVEGNGALSRRLRDTMDYKIWLETPLALRRTRGIERDGQHLTGAWDNRYLPEDKQYQLEQRPQDVAHYVVNVR